MPAALGVKEGINLPRYPTMKGRLASKKAELKSLQFPAENGGQQRSRLHRPEEQVSETVILGKGPEAASAIVDLLEELGSSMTLLVLCDHDRGALPDSVFVAFTLAKSIGDE